MNFSINPSPFDKPFRKPFQILNPFYKPVPLYSSSTNPCFSRVRQFQHSQLAYTLLQALDQLLPHVLP